MLNQKDEKSSRSRFRCILVPHYVPHVDLQLKPFFLAGEADAAYADSYYNTFTAAENEVSLVRIFDPLTHIHISAYDLT
jgi:hypothetical protein